MSRAAEQRVLAIDPDYRGFGYAVFEGADTLLDWGVTGTRSRTTSTLIERVDALFDLYDPEVIVIEAYGTTVARQRKRAQAFLRGVQRRAEERSIRVCALSRARMRAAFADAHPRNKDHVAMILANRYPELLPWLPKMRKVWMPAEYRMNIFDAVALAVTFFDRTTKRKQASPVEKPALIGITAKPWTLKEENPITPQRP